MRTPSATITTIIARKNTAMVHTALCVSTAAATARTTAMMVFTNMIGAARRYIYIEGQEGGMLLVGAAPPSP